MPAPSFPELPELKSITLENIGRHLALLQKELVWILGALDTDNIGTLGDVETAVQGTPTFTVGVEAADVINVAVQLNDINGDALAYKCVVRAWLSDTAGAAITATPPSGEWAIGTAGVILDPYTEVDAYADIITGATGQFDVNITETGATTFYLNIESQGRIYSSSAITFV